MDDRNRESRSPGGDAEEEAGGVEAEAEAPAGSPGILERTQDRTLSVTGENRIGVEEEEHIPVSPLPSMVHLHSPPRFGLQERCSVTQGDLAGHVRAPAVDNDHLMPPPIREEFAQTEIELIRVVEDRYDNGYLQPSSPSI